MTSRLAFLVLWATTSSCLLMEKRESQAQTPQARAFDEKEAQRKATPGSATIEKPGEHDRKIYFLYGTQHLGLENQYFDIPVVYRGPVKKWIRYFLNRGREFFERYSARAGRYAPLMGKILKENGLPQDLIFLAMAESGFQNHAKSWARAVGPWQFMPSTAKRYGLKINWYVDERRDPIKSTIAASRYLKDLFEIFGSWEMAAAGYNAGEGKIKRAIRRYKTESFWKIAKGRYLKRETKNYVPKIMALAIIGKNLKSFGFEEIKFHDPLNFDEVDVPGGTDLILLAQEANVEFQEIQRLNPEILRWFTPLDVKTYPLRLPRMPSEGGAREHFARCCQHKGLKATQFTPYKIRGKSGHLGLVAKKYKIKDPQVLATINDMGPHTTLTRGQIVLLPFRQGQSFRDPMYADLYERPRRSVRRHRAYLRRIRLAKKRGGVIQNPSQYYKVQRGDSLWSVARKFNVNLDNLIVSNLKIVAKRKIRAGDILIVK